MGLGNQKINAERIMVKIMVKIMAKIMGFEGKQFVDFGEGLQL